MCGIAGIFAYRESAPPVDERELLRIREAMIHRGPDGAGLWISNDRRIGLAHRRLSIIDVSDASSQPLSTPDGKFWISFNGEIYNYVALRAELKSKGHVFRTTGDTEVLLHLYMEYGEDMVTHLRGMFAFAIWDETKQALFLARDHFGIKPLYYADDGSTLRFASQVKALLKGSAIPCEPDYAGIVGFYLWGWVPDPFTTYASIKGLPAGHTMWITRSKQPSLRKFFDLSEEYSTHRQNPRKQSEIDRQHELAEAIRDSVKHHLVADVPVGVFLSAGLDSAVIAGHASEINHSPLKAITLGFREYEGTNTDEAPLAAAFAGMYQMEHHVSRVTCGDFEFERERILDAMDQPSVDGVNTYFVSKAAASAGLKVSLSGLGGDELFGGYPSFQQVPQIVRLLGFGKHVPSLGQAFRRVSKPLFRLFTSPKYASALEYGGSLAEAYFLRRVLYLPWELDDLFDPQILREGLERLDTIDTLACSVRGISSDRDAISILESSFYMRSQLLRDSDWAGMAHSLEIRVPFVDVGLLRAILRLGNKPTPISKLNVASTLPRPLSKAHLHRAKTGFATPVREWITPAHTTRPSARGLREWAKTILPPKRVLDITILTSDAFGGHGGIALYNRDIVNALLARTPEPRITVIPRLMPFRDAEVPRAITYDTRGLNSKLKFVWTAFSSAILSRKADLVICGHINLLPIAYLYSVLKGCPLVLFIYGIDAWKTMSNPVTRYLLRKTSLISSISQVTAKRFSEWSGIAASHIQILPNALHQQDYSPGPKPPYLLERYKLHDRQVILTLGRLAASERYKGVDAMLDLVPVLIRHIPDLSYVIAGTGDDLSRLKEKAERLGVADHVIFTGYVPEAEKVDLYRLADAYVMPSQGEGFGFVFLEALACGIPAVGSRTDGGREALREGLLGILVDPNNPEEIEQAVIRALHRPKGSVPEGLSYFSFDNFAARLNDVVTATVNGA